MIQIIERKNRDKSFILKKVNKMHQTCKHGGRDGAKKWGSGVIKVE